MEVVPERVENRQEAIQQVPPKASNTVPTPQNKHRLPPHPPPRSKSTCPGISISGLAKDILPNILVPPIRAQGALQPARVRQTPRYRIKHRVPHEAGVWPNRKPHVYQFLPQPRTSGAPADGALLGPDHGTPPRTLGSCDERRWYSPTASKNARRCRMGRELAPPSCGTSRNPARVIRFRGACLLLHNLLIHLGHYSWQSWPGSVLRRYFVSGYSRSLSPFQGPQGEHIFLPLAVNRSSAASSSFSYRSHFKYSFRTHLDK